MKKVLCIGVLVLLVSFTLLSKNCDATFTGVWISPNGSVLQFNGDRVMLGSIKNYNKHIVNYEFIDNDRLVIDGNVYYYFENSGDKVLWCEKQDYIECFEYIE